MATCAICAVKSKRNSNNAKLMKMCVFLCSCLLKVVFCLDVLLLLFMKLAAISQNTEQSLLNARHIVARLLSIATLYFRCFVCSKSMYQTIYGNDFFIETN